MNSIMPRFENKESLDRFLGNMKLQIFNAEFAALCKVSQDSMKQLFEDSNTAYETSEKNAKKAKSKLIDPKKPEELQKLTNPRSVLTKRKNSDHDIDQEILPHSEIKIKKHETMPLLQKLEESPKELPIPIPGMYSEEAKVSTDNVIHSPVQPNNVSSPGKNRSSNYQNQNSVVNNSKSHTVAGPKNPEEMPLRTADGLPITEESFNGPVKPKFIQPIYIYYSENQVGYIEVDIMDENAMRNVTMMLSQNQIPPNLNPLPPQLNIPTQLNNNFPTQFNNNLPSQFHNNFPPQNQ